LKTKKRSGGQKWDLSALYFSRANIYQNKLEIEKMKADLIKGVEWHPIPIIMKDALTFMQNKRCMYEALNDLNKAIEMDSDKNVGLFMRRGDVYFSMKKYSEAIKEYEQVLKQKTRLETARGVRRISQAKQKMQETAFNPSNFVVAAKVGKALKTNYEKPYSRIF
jgi:tetratricopeptide (TPR) repeat protein